MRTEHGEYKKGEIPKCAIEPCPVCGSEAELWLFSDDFENGPINKLMMCTNGEKFGPQEGFMNEGCLLFMPPDEFHRHRAADAVKFWNEYARALVEQRNERIKKELYNDFLGRPAPDVAQEHLAALDCSDIGMLAGMYGGARERGDSELMLTISHRLKSLFEEQGWTTSTA